MSKSKIFIWLCVSFALGVWLASRFNLPREYVYGLLAFASTILVLAVLAARHAASLAAVFLLAACLGALRLQASQIPNEFSDLFGAKQRLEGYVVEDPDIRPEKQMVTFRPKGYGQNVLATLPLTQEYFYGDWIVAEGKVAEPKNFEDFDYQKYLERFNVYATMSYPKILILKSHQLNPVKENLLKIKHAFAQRISNFLNEPQASLLMGILIGARKTLPQNVVDNFNATGVSHIIAISGYNISIIIKALEYLARLLGRKMSFWLSLLVIAGFVIVSGASASVIRAAIMGGCLLLAFYIGRQYSISPILFFSAFVMLLLNPKILYWDISFQLSFAATAGIVYFSPLLETATAGWPGLLKTKDIFLTTMAAIVVTLPLILLYFGRLSLVAPVTNILLLPFIPFTML
ncbi:MAG: competence protein ComEC family protein, partial [Patescibacteria group bacterium]|nr:competence protein ComEC family protein [Patescibacteria group bacterium]